MPGKQQSALDALKLITMAKEYKARAEKLIQTPNLVNQRNSSWILSSVAASVKLPRRWILIYSRSRWISQSSSYRKGGPQKVVVEHVHVYPGGQTLVGNVNQPESEGGQGD